jgi:hypothetical protein
VLWIRIHKDPNLFAGRDPYIEVSDPDPGQDLKLDVNINKNHKMVTFVTLTLIRYKIKVFFEKYV